MRTPTMNQAPAQPGAAGDTEDGQTENLQALADEGRALDLPPLAPGAPDPAIVEAQASAANIRAIVAALKGARAMAAPKFAWWQDYRSVWADDQLQGIAGALEAVRDHMGWDTGELMAQFGPWLALLLATGVPAWTTYEAIQQRRRELAAQAQQRQRQANNAAPGG